jgi:uncharacterized protein (UPF0264 family)
MALFLASVRDADEARVALTCGADVIDVKDPGSGALGQASPVTIRAIVRTVAGGRPVSATIGDPPMTPRAMAESFDAVFAAGCDIAKCGWSGPGAELEAVALQARLARKVVIVIAADRPGSLVDAVPLAAAAGAFGLMLDTADKSAGSLLAHRGTDECARFVAETRARGMLCGLAGSLRRSDIASVLACRPDLAGFRGALCAGGAREAGLSAKACALVREAMPPANPEHAGRLRAFELAQI